MATDKQNTPLIDHMTNHLNSLTKLIKQWSKKVQKVETDLGTKSSALSANLNRVESELTKNLTEAKTDLLSNITKIQTRLDNIAGEGDGSKLESLDDLLFPGDDTDDIDDDTSVTPEEGIGDKQYFLESHLI